MPIGAVLGGAAIAAGGSVAAGAISSSAQKKAANKASDTAAATAASNNALQRDIYGQNKALLTPYSNNGLAASNALNDLLLGSPSTGGQTAPVASKTPVGTSEEWANGALNAMGLGSRGNSPATLQAHLNGQLEGPISPQMRQAYDAYVQAHPQQTGSAPASGGALDAFDRFRQGTNYQWRYNQGLNATASNFATKGALDSGAAEKAKIQYGQNIASGELSNYMNLLAGQQAMGLSAAGAVAGVGTTYAGNVAAQNTNASNVAANAALANGQANANMWGTVGQTAGQVGGALFQYGMGKSMTPPTNFNSGYNNFNSAYTMPVSSVQPAAYVPGGF